MATVDLDGVTKIYATNHRAVDNLELRVGEGELLVLLGPSGCGKTTILRMIAGLETITSGNLWLGGRLSNEIPARERDIAMVFQSGALYPHRSVRGNLAFPLEIAQMAEPERGARVADLAKILDIEDTLDRAPETLSGGQRQRVAIGRAIIREPRVFLMDEPLASLDPALRTSLRTELAALVRSLGVTTVYVTHDQVEALTLADRIAVIRAGVLEDAGTAQQVYADPATAFVAAFLSSHQINLVYGTVRAPSPHDLAVELGGQRLEIPATDPRHRYLLGQAGRTVIVGLRPDALSPASGSPDGSTLSGQLRSLEYHGHEWLAHVNIGAPPVDIDQLHVKTPADQPDPAETTAKPRPGTHRSADLVMRMPALNGWKTGARITTAVDLSQTFFFDPAGHRLDPILR